MEILSKIQQGVDLVVIVDENIDIRDIHEEQIKAWDEERLANLSRGEDDLYLVGCIKVITPDQYILIFKSDIERVAWEAVVGGKRYYYSKKYGVFHGELDAIERGLLEPTLGETYLDEIKDAEEKFDRYMSILKEKELWDYTIPEICAEHGLLPTLIGVKQPQITPWYYLGHDLIIRDEEEAAYLLSLLEFIHDGGLVNHLFAEFQKARDEEEGYLT